jgi:hypothetical protein
LATCGSSGACTVCMCVWMCARSGQRGSFYDPAAI